MKNIPSGTSGIFNWGYNTSSGPTGVGVTSGQSVSVVEPTSSVQGPTITVYKSFPTFTKLAVPTNTLSNGHKTLARFKVSAPASGDVGIYKFSSTVMPQGVTVTDIDMYCYTDSGFSSACPGISLDGGITTGDLNEAEISSGTTFNAVVQDAGGNANTIQIPAGAFRWFEVRGTTSGAASGDSVATQINGDTSCSVKGTATEIDAGSDDDFIWSPNNTVSVSDPEDSDWLNGCGIPGLPQDHTSVEVLSQ